jgi:tetratricopeptide (TPR) repeat protein
MKSPTPTLATLSPLLLLLLAAPASAAAPPPAAAGGARLDPAAVPWAATPELEQMAHRVARGKITTRQKLEAIVHVIFDQRHGLGFRYVSHPTLTATEALERREGNCLSLVNLFVAMSRAADVDTFFIEVEDFETFERRGDSVVRSTHVVGGVMIGNELRTVDFVPDRPKTYRRLRVLDDAEAAAHYFNAVGAEALLAGDLGSAEPLLRRAIEITPDLAEAWNNLGLVARRAGRLDDAVSHLERALAADPEFVPALENLSGIYRLAGAPARAEAAAARALELNTRNPYYLVTQAWNDFRAGELGAAEEHLQRARRLDKRIPEVHLLLGRVALARGDAERADELFARAERLGADVSEAYQHRLHTKIDRLLATAL